MFIFNSMRQGKGLCAIIAQRPFIQTAATIGLTTSLALANGVIPTNISLHNESGNLNSCSGSFKSNISVNALTFGEKTFQLNGENFHSPIAVKLLAQSDKDSQKFDSVSEAVIGTAQGAFEFALTKDIQQVSGMTPLDVSKSSGLGRMLVPTGTHTTRTQIFLSIPEIDNNSLANDKIPELILMGAIPNGTIKITPILAGNSEIQESLIFGRTLDIEPSDMAAGKTGISIVTNSASPQHICIIGLDLSGDLLVEAGRTVVGYQLECPAGSNSGIKLMPVGTQESAVFASDAPNLEMIALGSMDLVQNPSDTLYAQALPGGLSGAGTSLSFFDAQPDPLADNAGIISQVIAPNFKILQAGENGPLTAPFENMPSANTTALQNYDSPGNNPTTTTTPPPSDVPPPGVVPVPGAITLLGMAAGFMVRGRNKRL